MIAPTDPPLLKVCGLHAGYGPAKVLFGIDLEVATGEVVSLMGRNGMGKTTTIKSIMGLLPITAGQVTVAERDLTGRTVSFNYGDSSLANKIDPGESSFAVLLRVNTTEYTSGFFTGINGTAATAHTYIPSPVPEPETYAMLLAGLGVVGMLARRRKLG